MIDCAFDHSVPTSVLMAIAAKPATVPMTASAMPYSARSWPRSSEINETRSRSMVGSFSAARLGCVNDALSFGPQRADVGADGDGSQPRDRPDHGECDAVLGQVLTALLCNQLLEDLDHECALLSE